MKITFLGSGDGIPTAERHCSSIMLEVGKAVYLIDAGAPVLDCLMRWNKNINDLKAIFLTHYHGDHNDGLFSLLGTTQWAFRQAEYEVYFSDERIKNAVEEAVKITAGGFDFNRTKTFVGHEGRVYEDENVKVTYFATKHCQPYPSYSILVEAEGKKAFFSGDLSVFLNQKDFPKYVLENFVDVFVLELAHFGFDHLDDKTLSSVKTNAIYFNHASPPFRRDQVVTKDRSGEFPFRMIVATDNLEIDL